MIMALDHTMTQGDTLALDFDSVDEAGDVVSLIGATIRWQLSKASRKTALISKEIGAGITVTDAAGGLYTVLLEPVDTLDLQGTFYYEVEVVDADGRVSTVRRGEIEIERGLIGP
jgi:hypothetical protein